MEKNVPLLRKMADWAYGEWLKSERGEQSEWNQAIYIGEDENCGTVCCIAGKTALEVSSLRVEGFNYDGGPGIVGDYDGGYDLSIREIASRALGLNYMEAGVLFSGGNTISDVYAIMNVITNGEITPPHEIGENPRYKGTRGDIGSYFLEPLTVSASDFFAYDS
jgi:hypothetical protein